MVSLIKPSLGISLFAAVALWSGASTACQLELDNLYTITPFVDDGLSRAERVNCALGELRYYDGTQGWLDMLDESGKPLRVKDMAGVTAPAGELLVVILEDSRVALRWGGPGGGDFFASDAAHSALYAVDRDGERFDGQRIGDVSIDRNTGLLKIGILTSSEAYCEVKSDDQMGLQWDWACHAAKAAELPQEATESRTSTKWSCRNEELEVTCDRGGCQVAEAHTPMDITVSRWEMSVCAYSGCWSGQPASMTSSGSFLTFTGSGLGFSTNPDDGADISVTIETASRVATILVAGQFASPATCQPE